MVSFALFRLEVCFSGDFKDSSEVSEDSSEVSEDSSEVSEEFFSDIPDFSEIALEVCSSGDSPEFSSCSSGDSSGIVTFSPEFSSSSDCPNSS